MTNESGPSDHPVDDGNPLDEYDTLIELDRLEELIEALNELGVANRDELARLPPSPDSVQLLEELDSLHLRSRDEIEARLAELEARLDDDD